MSKSELKPLKTNLIKQNCFVRECVNIPYEETQKTEKYLSVDEITTDKGIELKYTEHDYPITPEYVNSFADSSDYRRDPMGAIANGSKRPNLGDITEMQEVASMDMESARSLYEQLKAKFGEVTKQKQEKETDNEGGDNNG